MNSSKLKFLRLKFGSLRGGGGIFATDIHSYLSNYTYDEKIPPLRSRGMRFLPHLGIGDKRRRSKCYRCGSRRREADCRRLGRRRDLSGYRYREREHLHGRRKQLREEARAPTPEDPTVTCEARPVGRQGGLLLLLA